MRLFPRGLRFSSKRQHACLPSFAVRARSACDAAKHGVVGLAASTRADLKDEGLSDRVKVVLKP